MVVRDRRWDVPPGVWRTIGVGPGHSQVWAPPTRVHLVGTPFHSGDLLMAMRANPIYEYRRCSAEFDVTAGDDTSAVEVA